ncbi:MAG: hypothetical protein JW910_16130, partial [Anaerolineae bacterium]|nr:hypothetical protein [Anaerolineae bacterium]
MNQNRRRIVILIILMSVIAFSVGGITLVMLYDTSLAQQRTRLVEVAQSRARLIEAVARFTRQTYGLDHTPEETFAAVLAQITEAHEQFQG